MPPRQTIRWRVGAPPALLLIAAAVALVGCGAATARTTSPGTAPAAASGSTAVVTAPNPTPTATSTVDVTAAEQSALDLFVKIPMNLDDPSAGYIWSSGPASASHMNAAVKARLAELGSEGYFSDGGGCGEDYLTATQNGLSTAPHVSSAIPNAGGTVTVVIQRGAVLPDLTAVMTKEGDTWLASGLASGTGPATSIFSVKPNC